MNDRKRLIAAAFVRAVATGLIGVLLGLHLVRRGLAVGDIGLMIAAGLAGAAAAALVATLAGDPIGRRRLLIILALACATVAFAPSLPVAAILFLLRKGLVEMDVPTRQSYVMAMVRPEERVIASGVTHLVRLGGRALEPAFAGVLMQLVAVGSPLVVGAAMKVIYDVLPWRAFRHIRPPEERSVAHGSAAASRDAQP